MNPDKAQHLIIAYHADCIDGAASAWAVAKAWGREETSDNITYVPYEHFSREAAENDIRDALTQNNAVVYFVDVAPETEFLDEMMVTPAGAIHAIHILDHHKSAGQRLKDYQPPLDAAAIPLEIKIEEKEMSAARMVWKHVMPEAPVPAVLDIINKMDGDAAGLKTPEDFAAAALVDSFDICTQKKAFDALRGLAKQSFNDIAQKGRMITADQAFKIEKMLSQATFITLQLLPNTEPVTIPVINANVQHFGRSISEALVSFAKKNNADVACAWFVQKNGKVTMSLRSDGTPDLSAVISHLTKTMGNCAGGGHAGAGAIHFTSLFEFARQVNFVKPQHSTTKNNQPPQP